MKDSVKELAAISSATTTSSSGVSDVQGSEWLKKILEAAKKKMFYEQFAYVTDVQMGNKDVIIPLATSNIDFTDNTTQTDRTMTEIDNVSVVTLTPGDHKFGVAISDTVVRTSQVDYVSWARDQISYDMALNIDTAMSNAIFGAGSSAAANLYGGTATTPATLVAGDTLTPSLLIKAQRYLKANGWISEPDRPFIVFLAAICEEALLDDSQFTNAAEYGNNEVILNGEIGKYVGMKVISTEVIKSYASGAQDGNIAGGTGLWGADGHLVYVVKAKVSYGLAWGLRPRLETEYKKLEAAHMIYLDAAYASDSLQDGSIVLIRVTDV